MVGECTGGSGALAIGVGTEGGRTAGGVGAGVVGTPGVCTVGVGTVCVCTFGGVAPNPFGGEILCSGGVGVTGPTSFRLVLSSGIPVMSDLGTGDFPDGAVGLGTCSLVFEVF